MKRYEKYNYHHEYQWRKWVLIEKKRDTSPKKHIKIDSFFVLLEKIRCSYPKTLLGFKIA